VKFLEFWWKIEDFLSKFNSRNATLMEKVVVTLIAAWVLKTLLSAGLFWLGY
jgi:fumarate reductase subunit C